MRNAWQILHNYIFKDLRNQSDFLVDTALPHLLVNNNSLSVFEMRYFLKKLQAARTELNESFISFKSKIHQRFGQPESPSNDSYIVMDYLNDAQAKYDAIDWSKLCAQQIYKIEQVSLETNDSSRT